MAVKEEEAPLSAYSWALFAAPRSKMLPANTPLRANSQLRGERKEGVGFGEVCDGFDLDYSTDCSHGLLL